jgi:hypothetical protein
MDQGLITGTLVALIISGKYILAGARSTQLHDGHLTFVL